MPFASRPNPSGIAMRTTRTRLTALFRSIWTHWPASPWRCLSYILLCVLPALVGCERSHWVGAASSGVNAPKVKPRELPLPWDPRLNGAWKAFDENVDTLTFDGNGGFQNRLHPSSFYRGGGVQGSARLAAIDGKSVVVLSALRDPPQKPQAAEMEFVENDLILKMTHVPYPPETPGGVVSTLGFIPRGYALVKMGPDGSVDEALAQKAKQMNREFAE